MKVKGCLIICLFLIILVPGLSLSGSLVLVPNLDQPQDAVDGAIFLPEAGLGIAMTGFDLQAGSAFFIFVKNGSVVRQEFSEDVKEGGEPSILEGCEVFVTEVFDQAVELFVSCPGPYAVVLANSIDRNVSHGFIDHLIGSGVEVELVDSEGFPNYRSSQTVIILGGPDSPEGVGTIVSEVLTDEEESYLRAREAKGMFIHESPWASGAGNVVVLAGNNRTLTSESALENKERFKS